MEKSVVDGIIYLLTVTPGTIYSKLKRDQVNNIDPHRVKIIHDEIDRYMGQHKISMDEVLAAVQLLYGHWEAKGSQEPDYAHRDNYGQYFTV